MTVYVDDAIWPWRGKLWCHLMASSLEELHDFAKKLGLQRNWYQSKANHAHYDITENKRLLAIQLGAIEINTNCISLYKKVIDEAKIQQKRYWLSLKASI